MGNAPLASLLRFRPRAPRLALLLATTALTAPGLIASAAAQNLPTGGSVAAGSASVSQTSPNSLGITQSSQSAVVNWQSFSIGQGYAVNINQPNSSSALLNRVTGNTPSSIAGSLTANGQVYLVNPNGIAITSTGTVNVGGGFVASTLGISDADFMSGKRTFTGNGSSASVSNAGTITVGRGGYSALIGGTVTNSGNIYVPLGKVGLGSGERATLDFSGDGFLQVALPTNAKTDGALIENAGTIKADGGAVIMQAATAREAARNAINMSGVVQARSIGGRTGAIEIGGGDGGKVSVSGRLTTASRRAKGGNITVTGKDIALAGAKLDASGKSGGGNVKVGGDRQGGGTLQRAQTTTIDAASSIKADATSTGNGGNVVVWSDVQTNFAGTISAKGGADGGNGGEAEVSGKATLGYTGFTDLSAANGRFGTLLLDPYNVIISNAANSNQSGFSATGNDSIINVGTLQTALGSANVTITTGSGGSQAGDITVAAPITWSTGSTLTLSAYHSIAVNANITVAGGGGLALNSNQGGTGGTISYALGASAAFASGQSGQSLAINGQSYTLIRTINDLQNINSGLTGRYALANSIEASATQTWNNSFGFFALGTDGNGNLLNSGNGFTGTFDGLGNQIGNLYVRQIPTDYVGLFGYVGAGGVVRNVGLPNINVSGSFNVGAIAGTNKGTITQSWASGIVVGAGPVGGLVGNNDGTVSQSFSNAAVDGRDSNAVGGLVGRNTGTISQSYATGAVLGSRYVGGLVGMNINLGAGATITQSYATGAVLGTAGTQVGGLVGDNSSGSVSNSVFDTTTSGQTNGIGSGTSTSGATGLTTAQLQGGTANGLGAAFGGGSGGLYPYLSIFYPNGVQAISGIAYKADGVTPLSSSTPQPIYAKNPVFVGADIDGAYLGGVTTGVNGYYYIMAPAGLLTAGAKVIAYTNVDTNPNNTSGATNAATLTIATGAASLSNLNIYGNMLTVATSSTLLSGAPTAADATAAAGGDPLALAAIGGATGRGYLGAGASLSIDQAITTSGGLLIRTVAANAPITVDAPITINGSGSLTLNATGGVQVNKTINVTGAGSVNITAAPVTDVSTTGLTFALGSSIDYGATNNGGTFTLNGTIYTLVYSMANFDAIDGVNATNGAAVTTYGAGTSGYYALATNLNASGITYNRQLLGGFSGMLDGLGHTVSNMTIGGGLNNNGMIATLSGTLSNFGMVGGSVNANLTGGTLAGSVSGSGVVQTSYSTASIYASSSVGGLVGQNDGTIQASFSTGNVSTGGQNAGGLAGRSNGTIKNSFASGAISAGQYTGGLVGLSNGLTTQSLFIGTVSGGGGNLAGIAGNVGFTPPFSTNLYWDTQTSGTSAGKGYDVNSRMQTSGMTTADLQSGALPGGLPSNIWGAGAGLYPYLKNFYPTGPQVVSGTAYSYDGTTTLAGKSIGAIANGSTLGNVSTGANGYYYFMFTPGTLSNGASLLTYTGTNSATLTTATGAAAQGGVNLYDQTLTAQTSAILLSNVRADVASKAGGNAAAIAAINGAFMYDLTATGASFTLDQTIDTARFAARTTTPGASLTVASPITIGDGGDLTLNSAGALRINAPVTMKGASTASLGYDATDPANFTFAIGSPLTYTNADGSIAAVSAGGTLSINGQSYQLLYTMDDLAGINNGSGRYALVNSLNPTGSYSDAVVGYLTGTFDGLGHTITGLTINSANPAGLFAFLGGGTIRNIGLVGGSVTGGNPTGALVGRVMNGGIVANAYATTTVNSSGTAGGLIGQLDGTVVNSFATGSVSGGGFGAVGGLIGYAQNSVVRDVFATGAVSGYRVGGLIGYADGGSLGNAYATGAASGSESFGGLLGIHGTTLTNGYTDTSTAGRGGVGLLYNGTGAWTDLTTAQLQSGGASGLGSAFAGGASGLYPYLKSFFPNGVQAVSGYATQQDGVTPWRTTVSVANGGAVLGSASTGVNGYYYVFAPAWTTLGSDNIAAYTTASNGAVTFQAGTVSQLTTNLNLTDGWRRDAAGILTSLSALNSAFSTTIGTTAASGLTLANRQIDSQSPTFALDQALSITGTLALSSSGAVTQSAAITAGGLLLTGAGSFTLGANGNQIGTLAANAGGLNLANTGNLTIGSLANATGTTTGGVTTSGGVTVATNGGDLTIAADVTVSGTNPVLAATGAFINNRGADAVNATSGRWLIYSADPVGNTFGDLDSGNTATFSNTLATLAPGSVTQSGNRYIFSVTRMLTVTSTDASKTYGDDAGAAIAGNYVITGYDPGIAGVYLGDSAGTAFSGAASVTSTGAAATANVAGSPYVMTAALGTLTSQSGYTFSFVNDGRLTVTPRAITVSADAQSKVYGNADPTLSYTVGGLGLANSDTLAGLLGRAAGENVMPGGYAITQGGVTSANNPNYAITYTGNTLTITPRAITVTANAQSKVYGSSDPTLGYTVGGDGLVGGDTLAGSLTRAAGENVVPGGYAIGQGGITNASNPNYAISYTGNTFTIAPAMLTIAPNSGQSKTYGQADPTFGYVASGQVVNPTLGIDDSGLNLTGALGRAAGENVAGGPYGYTLNTLSAGANYTLVMATNPSSFAITPATLTIAPTSGQSKTYGQADPTFGYVASGQIVNPTLGIDDSSLGMTGALGRAAGETVAGGPYGYALNTLSAGSNYTLVMATNPSSFAITPATLTYNANTGTRQYGDANPAMSGTVTGYVNGETAATALTGTLTFSSGATGTSGVGNYDITGSGLTANNGNYVFVQAAGNATALSITPRTITVTADAQSKVYGSADPTLTYTVGGNGLVNGDTLSGLLSRTAGENVIGGGYAIGQGGVTDTNNPNYAITYTGNTLTITPATLTYVANAATRQYGDANPALSGSVTGYVNGDSQTTATTGALTFTTGASGTSGVGSYDITGSGLTLNNANYVFAQATGNSTALSVTPRAITVTADAKSRVYGDGNPPLSYAIGGGGLVNGDTLSGDLASSATATSNVGGYAITQGSLAASSNYALTYTGATLTVTPRAITVTADAKSRVYGDTNPVLTYTLGGMGLINGDTLSGGLASSAGATSNVGGYAITQGSLAASANYALSYTGNTLTVTPRSITVSADAASRIYGDANPSFTYTVGDMGLVNGDTLSGNLASAANATSNVGGYTITQGSLAASANYTTSFTGATLTVTQRPITVTADAKTKFNGEPNPALTYAISGAGLVNGDTLTGALATTADTGSLVGSYAITQGTVAASANYLLTYVGASLVVQPRSTSNYSAIVDRVLAPNATPVALPVGATVIQGAPQISTTNGVATFYADPRSDRAFVCVGGACFVAF